MLETQCPKSVWIAGLAGGGYREATTVKGGEGEDKPARDREAAGRDFATGLETVLAGIEATHG